MCHLIVYCFKKAILLYFIFLEFTVAVLYMSESMSLECSRQNIKNIKNSKVNRNFNYLMFSPMNHLSQLSVFG